MVRTRIPGGVGGVAPRGVPLSRLGSVMRRGTIGLPACRHCIRRYPMNGWPCRGQGPFRGPSLMIVLRAGASSCAAKFRSSVFSRNIEVTITTVPVGTGIGAADPAGPVGAGEEAVPVSDYRLLQHQVGDAPRKPTIAGVPSSPRVRCGSAKIYATRSEVRAGIEPTFADLQSAASPLCHRTSPREGAVYRVCRRVRSRADTRQLGALPAAPL